MKIPLRLQNLSRYQQIILILFIIFAVINVLCIHRLPGLFGDEGSEGQNVYELLTSESLITVFGERSYIGPLIDYIRIPFIALFDYTALALRIPMYLFSLATFLLAAAVLRRLFGNTAGLYALIFFAFNPIYLTYQRLGWAVTLFPFFAFLLLFVLLNWRVKHSPLLAGIIAGLGLHNYISFFPTIAGIMIPWFGTRLAKYGLRQTAATWWPWFVGAWAGFGTQFAVMQLYQEDQGKPWEVVGQVADRVSQLPEVLPRLLSGSIYATSYTGRPFSPEPIWFVIASLGILSLTAIIFSKRRAIVLLWTLGTAIQLATLLLMIDRFTLRYFVVFNLAVWILAGVGLGIVMKRLQLKPRAVHASALILATVLVLATWNRVFQPYLETGGQISRFSLDDPKSTAEVKVDIIPLLACLRGKALVYSDDIHIRNRLIYLEHSEPNLSSTADLNQAVWLVRHRDPNHPIPTPNEACPELKNFRVVRL